MLLAHTNPKMMTRYCVHRIHCAADILEVAEADGGGAVEVYQTAVTGSMIARMPNWTAMELFSMERGMMRARAVRMSKTMTCCPSSEWRMAWAVRGSWVVGAVLGAVLGVSI